jgi:hypothetical protein
MPRLRPLAFALAIVLVLPGCRRTEDVAPPPPPPPPPPPHAQSEEEPDDRAPRRVRPIACPANGVIDTARVRIDARGGRLGVRAGDTLVVPPNGVSEPRTFTMYRSSRTQLVTEVRADGPVDSVQLQLSFARCRPPDLTRLFIARMENDSTGVPLGGGVHEGRGVVIVRLESLSPYAIASN